MIHFIAADFKITLIYFDFPEMSHDKIASLFLNHIN